MFTVRKTDLKVIIEHLKAPFGFKGGYARELWQVVVKVESDANFGIGLGVQSTLWSDASVYASNSYCGGNALMLLITEYALKLICGKSFSSPIEALDDIKDDVYEYAKKITAKPELRKTFALNALVAVDNALWQLAGKERLCEFLDYAKSIGALERIAIVEEPFDEANKVDVSDLGVRIAADESAHSCEDVIERIKLGYGAIALKPIAKTLSETLKILKAATENNIPCFCADLTVNPLMVEFNKNIAARIDKFPGVKIGILESNGHQNYVNWEQMKTYHPMYGKGKYLNSERGIFCLDDEFYDISGAIFKDSDYYCSLFD